LEEVSKIVRRHSLFWFFSGQPPEIFNDTIRFNVTFGFDADEKEILKAIDIARFSSVLNRLPQGLSSKVNEKGVNLSGGERQRLALARGVFFATDKELILFDEATSSVDPVNERAIYQNIFAEFTNKCIVCSIHRLNLLDLFDYVYVFGLGKILEEGEPSRLLQDKQSALARMYKSLSADDAQVFD
jgi:ABC-type multidrug transport system fused ATPase/permease subunit